MIARKGALVLVADGGGATLYRIANRVNGVKLDDVEAIEAEAPGKSSEVGRDRPGRLATPGGPTSAVESPDHHDRAEEAFARVVADKIDSVADGAAKGVVLFASPRFLGMLRPHLSERARAALSVEVPKDCRSLKLADLERAVDALDG